MEPSRPPGCENCKEECTIHLSQIIKNQIKKVDMCENCPNAKSIQDPNQFNLLSELIGKPPAGSGPAAQALQGESRGLSCDTCGYAEEMLRKTGRMGCPDCYTAFQRAITPMLSNMHKGVIHTGKMPDNFHLENLRRTIRDLQSKIDEFIRDENYEAAAQTRDRISELQKQLEEQPK